MEFHIIFYKEIALDRSAWRLAINVPEPWTYFFRVSSLAYPNLLGKKNYVVVVVVVDRCTYSYLGFCNVVLYCSEGKHHSHFITNSRNIIYIIN